VVVDLGTDPDTGTRRRKWHSGYRTKRDAERARVEILRRLDTGSYIEPTTVTVAEYLAAEWLPAIRGQIRASTFDACELHVRRYIAPRIGDVPLQKLTRGRVKALYAELAEAGRERRTGGLSPKTVHNVHLTLRKALADAVADDLIPRNPAERAHKLPTDRPEMRTWSPEQLKCFLDHVAEDWLAACWRLAATTGMRRGELLALRWEEVALDAGRVTVVRQLVKADGGVRYGRPKTSRGRRMVAIDAATVAALRTHRRKQLEIKVAVGRGFKDEGLIFCMPDGSPIDPDGLTQRFERHVRQAGLPRIRLHDLRHTHATLALAAGVHPKVVQERLGHSSIVVTLDTYSHAIPALQEDAAARLAALVDGGA
jgi:integrase